MAAGMKASIDQDVSRSQMLIHQPRAGQGKQAHRKPHFREHQPEPSHPDPSLLVMDFFGLADELALDPSKKTRVAV